VARCYSYLVGECTWGACELAPWLPEWLGNADQWLLNASRDGLQLTSLPTTGAIVSFQPGGWVSPLGHVGLVVASYSATDFDVREMNWSAFNRYDVRHATTAGVNGFILPPGVAPGGGGPGPISPQPVNLDAFSLSWADLQRFWNVDVEQEIYALQALAAQLQAIAAL
jgi:hypothetical protein